MGRMSRLNWMVAGVSAARANVTVSNAKMQKAAVGKGIGE
jgi:hypothetical protein